MLWEKKGAHSTYVRQKLLMLLESIKYIKSVKTRAFEEKGKIKRGGFHSLRILFYSTLESSKKNLARDDFSSSTFFPFAIGWWDLAIWFLHCPLSTSSLRKEITSLKFLHVYQRLLFVINIASWPNFDWHSTMAWPGLRKTVQITFSTILEREWNFQWKTSSI